MHRRAQSPLRRKGSILNPASPRHPFAKPAVQPAAAALPRVPGANPAFLPTAAAVSRLPGAKPAVLPTVAGFPAFRVRNRRFCPRPLRFSSSSSRVRNRPFCPRLLRFSSTPPSSPTSGPPLRRRPTPASPFSCLATAPPLRPVFPSFPATPLQNVVAIPSLPTFRSVRSRCWRWDETVAFPGFCAVSVLGMGRDCCFSGVLCGLGAGEGTRLLFFRGFVLSRCLRRDETVVFPGFCVVSVPEKGRDCCFSGVLCGLGAWDGTRLLLFRDFVWSRCLGWDETAVFPGFCTVSVLEMGRDCCFSGVLCCLGA